MPIRFQIANLVSANMVEFPHMLALSRALTVVATLVVSTAAVAAETWPKTSIHVVVPFAPGSIVDLIPRVIFERVSADIGVPVLIENRPGAGGTIGAATVARSIPDGDTLLVNSNAQVVAPLIHPNFPYSPLGDFSPIAALVVYPNVLVVPKSGSATSLQEFVRMAKASKNKVTFASLGPDSATYMNAERFRMSAGFDAISVTFNGAPAAIREVMAGRVDFCFCAVGTTLPYIRDGSLIPLAVGTPTRTPLLPDVPTTTEAGFSGSDYTPWLGLFAPAHTPADVEAKIYETVTDAMGTKSIEQKLEILGATPMAVSRDQLDSFLVSETNLNSALLQQLGGPTFR